MKKFEDHITQIIERENSFIYKSNLELLRKFYTFIVENISYEILSDLYLESFNTIESIKPDKIEQHFSDLILEYATEFIDYDCLNEYETESGVYAIYNSDDRLIYIGKSNHLSTRSLQSFLNKLPYGSSYLKILDDFKPEVVDFIEAICIDWFLPIYNNKKEPFSLTHKQYMKLMTFVLKQLDLSKRIYPFKKVG
jgi:hypothetical protein